MTVETWMTFLAACWLISLSPGAGAIKSMSTGMRHGFRRGIFNILGLQLGVIFLVIGVAAGLGAVLATSAIAFNLIKWLGVTYLIWLGIKQWRTTPESLRLEPDHSESPGRLILEGFLVNASNPKGIIFMLAVLPQFIDPEAPMITQYLLCTASLVFTDIIVMSAYTIMAARVLISLSDPLHVKWVNRSFGSLFVGAGVLLGTLRRSS